MRHSNDLGAQLVGSSPGLRTEMHFSTKCLQTMFRCIRHISGKATLFHHYYQTSGVDHTAGEADSCEVVISLRNPWAGGEVKNRARSELEFATFQA